MRSVVLLIALTVSVALASHATEMKRADILSNARPSVVTVVSYDGAGNKITTGTGFIVGGDGLIATCWHIVSTASKVKINRNNGASYTVDGLAAWDVVQDYAILKVNARRLPPLTFADSDDLKPGQKIIALGREVGSEQAAVDGTVKAVRTPPSAPKLIQINTEIAQGNAGGPVLDMQGRVVGIASCLRSAGQEFSFAVPINALKPKLEGDPKVTGFGKVITDPVVLAESFYLKGIVSLPESSKSPDARKRFETSLGFFLQAVDKNANYPEARFYASYCLSQLDRHEEAVESFKRTIRLKPDYADAHFGLGLTYISMGYVQDAVQSFEEVIRVNPDYADAHYNLALLYVQQGWTDEAAEALKEVVRIDPDYVEAHYNLGVGYVDQGRYEEAVESFKHAIRIRPNLAQAHFGLGVAYGHLGRDMEAVETFKQVIRINPDHADAHFALGESYLRLERFPEAADSFAQAVRLQPEDAEAHCRLGIALDKQGRPDDALESLKRAVTIDPKCAEAYFSLGSIYVQRDDRGNALESYKSLKDIDETLAEKLFKLIYP